MMVTIEQQLRSLQLTMERTVMPAIPPEARFAQEQAGLIWATLGWLVDVAQSEFGYELAEAADYRALLADLAALPGASSTELQALLGEPAAGADGDLVALREQTRRMKQSAVEFLAGAPADLRGPARRRMLAVAERQSRREQAWCRMTGLVGDQPRGIAEVLAAG